MITSVLAENDECIQKPQLIGGKMDCIERQVDRSSKPKAMFHEDKHQYVET